MRHSGTITRLVHQRGFGFIREDTTGHEYFFHRSALQANTPFEGLEEGAMGGGTKVTFELGDSAKGPRAENVAVA